MTQTVQDPSIDEVSNHQLTAADRCDSCGAQAYIRATMSSGELYFCAHHGAEFKEKLAATAIEWHDESSRLYESK
jgi:predicted nucleic acid-binding Zn ribbon protein